MDTSDQDSGIIGRGSYFLTKINLLHSSFTVHKWIFINYLNYRTLQYLCKYASLNNLRY